MMLVVAHLIQILFFAEKKNTLMSGIVKCLGVRKKNILMIIIVTILMVMEIVFATKCMIIQAVVVAVLRFIFITMGIVIMKNVGKSSIFTRFLVTHTTVVK
jgi:hypothetical protein